jgi:hypothetical protein
MAAFQEVFRRSGIDERRSPPGMVVPFGGDNIVALIDPGRKLKVEPNPHALEIREIDGAEIRKRVMQVRDTFEPDVDKEFRAASLPATFNGDARFFEIKGRKKLIPFPGLQVVARSAGRKGGIEPKLRVAVLPEIKIKVAFRNVMVPGSGGAPAFHATKSCSEQDELLTMNQIWRPQANIRFERVPSDWLVIDGSQADVKQELADAQSNPASRLTAGEAGFFTLIPPSNTTARSGYITPQCSARRRYPRQPSARSSLMLTKP